MINATKKWIFLKISGATLVPLMLWFIINLINFYDQGYSDVVNFFTNSSSKFLFSIFIINAYFFSALSISEVFEDSGHGNSEGPCLDSIEKIADWLEKVFEELKLNNIILVGHSQGCLEALEYSFKYKSRLKKIVFIGGSYQMPVNKDLIDLAEAGDEKAVLLMMKWGYEGSKKFIGGNPVERIIQSPRDISQH